MGEFFAWRPRASRTTRLGGLLAAAVLAAAVGPASAAADTFFVAPGEPDSAACTLVDPCELEHAVEVVAGDGDTVQAAAGTYSGSEVGEGTNGIQIEDGITLDGDGATATTTIQTTSEQTAVVLADPDAIVSDLRIEQATSGGGIALFSFAGRAERVFARASDNNPNINSGSSLGCLLFPGTMIRDSVCRASAAGSDSFTVGLVGFTSSEAGIRVVGVTAVGDDAGIAGVANTEQSLPLSISNTIAQGAEFDVAALNDGPVVLDHSNFSTAFGTNVTAPGSGTNQTAEPVFVNPAGDDFREQATSPTVDAGDSSADQIGTQDIAGQSRVQGAAADIGAFELDSSCATPAGDEQNHLNTISYESAVLLDGPAAYWRLGESSGPTAFDSANGFDGTYTGTITLGVPGAIAFDPDTAADFSPDVKSRVPTPYAYAPAGSVRSFEGWACREENKGFDVFFSGEKRFNSPGMWTDHGDLDRIWFDPRREGGTAPRFWDGVVPPDGEWFHWVLVFNDPANIAELFINGASQGTRSVTEPHHSNPGSFQIGNYAQINEAWNGPLDEIAIYERALTPDEVFEHYIRGSGVTPPT